MAPSREQGSEVSVWPLLYLRANWAGPMIDCFDLGVKLIRADSETLARMKDIVGPNARFPGHYVFDSDVQWLLAIPVAQEVQYANSAKLGISTREEVARALVDTFLLSLRLVRQTAAVCPVWFGAKVDQNGLHTPLDSDRTKDYEDPWLDWDPGREFGGETLEEGELEATETFEEGDLGSIADLWDRLVHSFSLKGFLTQAHTEMFWQEIDRRATGEADDWFRARSPAISADPGLAEPMVSVLRQDQVWQQRHSEAFRNTLRARLDEIFLRATRIGRALGLFNEAFGSHPVGAFLLMCFALETLFTVEKPSNRRGITCKLKRRAAELLRPGGQAGKPKEVKDKVGRILKERGDLVHGSKRMDCVPEKTQREAVDLTRLSLRTVLSRPELLKLYCDPSTSATPGKKEDVGGLREFFRKLDGGAGCSGEGK